MRTCPESVGRMYTGHVYIAGNESDYAQIH